MLIAVVLITLVLLALRMFLGAKDSGSGAISSSSLGDLETSLKKILEQAGKVPANDQVSAAVASENPEASNLVQEINKLKEELGAKQKEVETLKSNSANTAAAPAPGMNTDEKDKLDAKIRELQAKLSEYEIISEDIADLSFYKEQNAKLSKEVEALKAGGGAVAAAPAAEAASAPVAAAPADEPDIVGKAKATSEAILAEAGVAPAEPASETLMAEEEAAPVEQFAAAVEEQKAAPEQVAAEMSPPAPDVENVVDDNLMAEFDAAVEQQKQSEDPAKASDDSGLGDMDMDKMMAEAANITANGPEVSAEEALGAGLDENKLLEEATALDKVSTEDKKLMGDFENFVKKG